MEEYLEAGKIVNTHGVRGDVRVESYCDSTAVFSSLDRVYIGKDKREYKLTKNTLYKAGMMIHLEGVDNIEAAEKYKNETLYVKRAQIPKSDGGAFIVDMIGLDVIDAVTSEIYGKIDDVIFSPASQLYVVKKEGKTYYLPDIPEFVSEIKEGKTVYVTPPEGLFDEV